MHMLAWTEVCLRMCLPGDTSKIPSDNQGYLIFHICLVLVLHHMATMKLVIVEDEVSILQLYQTKFELEGFKVSTAMNGRDGLKIIKSTMPDLVLLDLRMPGMQGDEMLARLREEGWGANIRVIILTNISRNEAPPSLRFLAVDRYIVKAHYTPTQVVEVVREVIQL